MTITSISTGNVMLWRFEYCFVLGGGAKQHIMHQVVLLKLAFDLGLRSLICKEKQKENQVASYMVPSIWG